MKRLAIFVGLLVFVPMTAAAQVPPPAPPAPAAAPAPRAVPAPQAAPTPPVPPAPELWRFRELEEFARQDMRIDAQAARELAQQAREVARIDSDAIRAVADQAREMARVENDRMHDLRVAMPHLADMNLHTDLALQQARIVTNNMNWASQEGNDSGLYNSGRNAVDQAQYDRAIGYFDRVIAQRGSRADGALYWKAFAQYRLAKSEDALVTIALLRKDYPQSRYLATDAKQLELDARKMSGQPVNPATLADDEMKVLAIQGLGAAKAEQAIPLLEGVLNASNSLRVKKHALYVIALSADPRAKQILLRYAKGGGNPDLQMEAIRYLATRNDKQTVNQDLREIYESTPDVNVRREIINAYRSAGSKEPIIAIVQNTSTPIDVRRQAISSLSGLAAPPELFALYQKETDKDLKIQMIGVFSSMGALDQLQQIVKSEKDPAVRQRAIRSLGSQRAERTGTTLVDVYSADQDLDTRRAVIQALGSQNNAEGLIGIARKETNKDLKMEIVKRISEMAKTSKAAADYLMEVIK